IDGYMGTESAVTSFDNIDRIVGSSVLTDEIHTLDLDSTFTIDTLWNTYETGGVNLLFRAFEFINAGALVDTLDVYGANSDVLVYRGGAGDDIFRLFGTVSVPGHFDGQGGLDQLDYSGYTASGVNVNLDASMATAIHNALVGGVNSIEWIIGTAFGDVF